MKLNDIRTFAGSPPPHSNEVSAGVQEPRYSLIIPAHNEAARIGRSLPGYLDAFADSEVLLVLNGCNDDTAQVALAAAGSRTNLRVLYIDHAIGKGGAVRAGFLTARAPVIGYVDADGATPPEEIRRLFDLVDDEIDAVIASRWSKGSRVVVAQPALRRLSSRVFNAIVRVFFGLPFRDTQCGAKVFSSKAIRHISSSLEVSNFAFDIDLLYGLKRGGYRIEEVPTHWNDVGGSRINLRRASLEMLTAVLRLRIRHSLLRYVIPIFDRLWPTRPLRVRDGLAVLILNSRDPQHPQAGEVEAFLREVGAHLVIQGHRVHWLTAGFAGAAKVATIDGMMVTRAGNRLTVSIAVPLEYVRRFRDRFDVIVDVQRGIPLLSPLFSLKPRVCLVDHAVKSQGDHGFRPSTTFGNKLQRRALKMAYTTSRFVAISNDDVRNLLRLGISRDRIDIMNPLNSNSQENDVASPMHAADRFLAALLREWSRGHASFVRNGEAWSILEHRPLSRMTAPEAREQRIGTLP